MDDRTHVVVGVAGAGKTAMAMDLMEQPLREGLKFWEVGFLSFSRAACAEAVSRAAAITGEPEDRLTGTGFYKTIHAAVVRSMAVDTKSILDPDSKSGICSVRLLRLMTALQRPQRPVTPIPRLFLSRRCGVLRVKTLVIRVR